MIIGHNVEHDITGMKIFTSCKARRDLFAECDLYPMILSSVVKVAGSLARLNILFLNSLLIPESLPKKTIVSACAAIGEKTIVMKKEFRRDFTIQLENGLTQPRQSPRNHTFTVLNAAGYSSINAFLCKCKKKARGFCPCLFAPV